MAQDIQYNQDSILIYLNLTKTTRFSLWVRTISACLFLISIFFLCRFIHTFNFKFNVLTSFITGMIAYILWKVSAVQKYLKIYPQKKYFIYRVGNERKEILFSQVKSFKIQVDLSNAFHDIKESSMQRIVLELDSNQSLLLVETDDKEVLKEYCNAFKEIFQVPVEYNKDTSVQLGNYTIIKEISHGGMGKIFLANDQSLNQDVAVKILPVAVSTHKSVQCFLREINILKMLSHPNIVHLLQVGQNKTPEGTVYFYSMEYIQGVTLKDWRKEHPNATVREIISFFQQIASALTYIHSKNIIHLDIKPSNIMISGTKAILIDFGISRELTQNERKSRDLNGLTLSSISGTLLYKSPEQIKNQKIDFSTDIFSLGVALYEMLTLNHPFTKAGKNEDSITNSILKATPIAPSKLNNLISHDIDIVVLHALEKEKYNRYKNMLEFLTDLQNVLDGKPILAYKLSPIVRLWRKIKMFFIG